ncbi:energy transducer TonB [Aureibacter tunicatorum]|uniref:TonB family protein n=1 Tax=Aureibacter tunicatorum TaxID=866807 RepID=A0AAE4BV17_9BACT|nr:energy transducer TonB [Aureibacter tunicatorum]MDR6241333.1 TonB family protein [Aureibacter tunicatorum]BDD03592.1 hypothetical protein AUTU_10750 [Aureibacter tunicatorum]
MKKILFLIFALWTSESLLAQKRTLLDEHLNTTDSTEAKYYRIESDKVNDYTTFKIYHMSGELYQQGRKLHRFEEKKGKFDTYEYQDGYFITYHKNGNQKTKVLYKEDIKEGIESHWYSNKQLQKEVLYDDSLSRTQYNQKVVSFYDSLGKQLISEGNGTMLNYENNVLIDSGMVKDMRKHGKWKGYDIDSKLLSYEEKYENGELVRGVSFDDQRNKYSYEQITEEVSIGDKGIKGLYEFISNNLKYPGKARRRAIQGSVYIKMIISKEGNVNDIIIINNLNPYLNEETLRVLSLIDRVTPYKLRGQGIKHELTFPVIYRLR